MQKLLWKRTKNSAKSWWILYKSMKLESQWISTLISFTSCKENYIEHCTNAGNLLGDRLFAILEFGDSPKYQFLRYNSTNTTTLKRQHEYDSTIQKIIPQHHMITHTWVKLYSCWHYQKEKEKKYLLWKQFILSPKKKFMIIFASIF